jgi:hypothetical protein
LRKKISAFLSDGPKCTIEILTHINTTTHSGATKSQITNVLAGDPNIEKVGKVKVMSRVYGSYKVSQWQLKEEEI